jgi:putative ABC transport system permease protein
MDLAIKDVQLHVGKFIATIIGVGLLMAIVLIMNGIYQGNTSDGVWLIDNTDTDLWVVEYGRGGPFNEQSRIAEESWKSVAAIPGVAKASPFITYTVQRNVAGRAQQFTIIGYDVFGGLGGPGRIVAGRPIAQAHYEVVADMKIGLKLGDAVRLGVHDYVVVGLTRKAVDAGGNPLLYLSLPDAQEVLYDQDNRTRERTRMAETQRLIQAGYTPAEAGRMLPLFADGSDTVNSVLVKLRPEADLAFVTEQIERYENLAIRFKINGSDAPYRVVQAAYKEVLARLTEDEK